MKFSTLQGISRAIAKRDIEQARYLIQDALNGETGIHWQRDLSKLDQFLMDGEPRFKVLAKDGNSKLPFLAFSSLPGMGHCPGASETGCLQFCYSFRAWRYPAAFCRQVQNTVLTQTLAGMELIANEIDKHKPDSGSIDFRLYVDGDFASAGSVMAWMRIIKQRPWLNTYGYSKSWAELLDYNREAGGDWPSNYTLNLSSGSLHNDKVKEQVKQLPITRGEFIAVSVGYKVRSDMHNDREHQKALRMAHGKRNSFTCPGKCGSCTKTGHACGAKDRFKGIDIIIAVH